MSVFRLVAGSMEKHERKFFLRLDAHPWARRAADLHRREAGGGWRCLVLGNLRCSLLLLDVGAESPTISFLQRQEIFCHVFFFCPSLEACWHLGIFPSHGGYSVFSFATGLGGARKSCAVFLACIWMLTIRELSCLSNSLVAGKQHRKQAGTPTCCTLLQSWPVKGDGDLC